jgi:hypothetical protein
LAIQARRSKMNDQDKLPKSTNSEEESVSKQNIVLNQEGAENNESLASDGPVSKNEGNNGPDLNGVVEVPKNKSDDAV